MSIFYATTNEERLRLFARLVAPWMDGVFWGYEHRKASLHRLLAELRENGITDLTERDINPIGGQTASSIRALADKLLLLSVSLELDARSRLRCSKSAMLGYAVPEYGVDSESVHFMDEHHEVMTENFAQRFVDTSGVALLRTESPNLRFIMLNADSTFERLW